MADEQRAYMQEAYGNDGRFNNGQGLSDEQINRFIALQTGAGMMVGSDMTPADLREMSSAETDKLTAGGGARQFASTFGSEVFMVGAVAGAEQGYSKLKSTPYAQNLLEKVKGKPLPSSPSSNGTGKGTPPAEAPKGKVGRAMQVFKTVGRTAGAPLTAAIAGYVALDQTDKAGKEIHDKAVLLNEAVFGAEWERMGMSATKFELNKVNDGASAHDAAKAKPLSPSSRSTPPGSRGPGEMLGDAAETFVGKPDAKKPPSESDLQSKF